MFPFLSRELLVSLRERRRFLMLGLLVILAGIVTVTIWSTIQMQRMEISNYEISRAVFIGMTVLQMLIAPVVGMWAARCVAGEREGDTWDLLVAAPVRPLRLMLEKLTGHIVALLLLLAGLIPFLALCFLLGGVGPDEWIGAYVMVGVFTAVCAVLGFACSAWFDRVAPALRAYSGMLFLIFVIFPIGIAILCAWASDMRWIEPRFWGELVARICALSPIWAMGLHFSEGAFPGGMSMLSAGQPGWFVSIWNRPWAINGIFSILLILLLLRVTHARLRRTWYGMGGTNVKSRKAGPRSAGPIRSFIPRYANPVACRERLANERRFFGRTPVRLSLAASGGAAMALPFVKLFQQDLGACWVLFTYILFFWGTLLAASSTSSAIAGERSRKTWEMLSATLLSAETIVRGKLAASARRCAETIAIFAFFFFVVMFACSTTGRAHSRFWTARPSMMAYTLLVLGTWALQLTVGLYFSITSPNVMKAQSKTYFVVMAHLFLGLVLLLFGVLAHEFFRIPLFQSENAVSSRVFFSLSPLTLMADHGTKFGAWSTFGAWIEAIHGVILLALSVILLVFTEERLAAQMDASRSYLARPWFARGKRLTVPEPEEGVTHV